MSRLLDLLEELTCDGHDGHYEKYRDSLPTLDRDPEELPQPLDWMTAARDGVPPIPWQADGFLPKRSILQVIADWGLGKSWVLLDAFLCFASGQPLFDRFEIAKPCVSLYFDEENGPDEVTRRLAMLAKGRGIGDVGRSVIPFCYTGLKLDSDGDLQTIRALIELYRPGIIGFDSLVRFHTGNENDNSYMASRVMGPLRRLIVDYNLSTWVNHHPSKPSGQFPKPFIYRARGAGDLIGGADLYYFLSGDGESTITFQPEKVRKGPPASPFSVRLTEGDDGSMSLASMTLPSLTAQKAEKARATLLGTILDAGGSCDRPTIEKACERAGIGSRLTSDTFTELVKLGLIKRQEKLVDRKAIYDLTQAGREGLEWA
jgi:predicted transcriptional regulator